MDRDIIVGFLRWLPKANDKELTERKAGLFALREKFVPSSDAWEDLSFLIRRIDQEELVRSEVLALRHVRR